MLSNPNESFDFIEFSFTNSTAVFWIKTVFLYAGLAYGNAREHWLNGFHINVLKEFTSDCHTIGDILTDHFTKTLVSLHFVTTPCIESLFLES